MAQFIPKRDETLEGDPHQKWLEKGQLDLDKRLAAIEAWRRKLDGANATGGRQAAVINAKPDLVGTGGGGGLPAGGHPGDDIRQNTRGKALWMPHLSGATPRLYIHLEEGAPEYSWDIYNTLVDTEVALPPVVFYDDGRSFEVVGWRDINDATSYWSLLPINYDIQVAPHADGDVFEMTIPSNAYMLGSGETNNFTVTIHNSYATGFSADVRFGTSDNLFGGAENRYKDSRLIPWRVDIDADSYANLATLAPDDQLAWIVELAPTLENNLTPVLRDTLDDADRSVSFPLDYYYWRFVQSRRHAERVHVPGTVTVGALGEVLYNDSADSRRVGLLRATVSTAPTGAALEVDVKVDAVVVGTVTIPAGDMTATVEPSGYTHGPTGTHTTALSIGGDSVVWFPGDALSFEVTQVGSTVAGADLTVQVWAG